MVAVDLLFGPGRRAVPRQSRACEGGAAGGKDTGSAIATLVTSWARNPIVLICSAGSRRATSQPSWPAVPSGHGAAPESESPSEMETPFGSTPPAPRPGPPPQEAVGAVLVDGDIHLHVRHPSPFIAQVRTLPGRRWDPGRRV